MSEGFAALGIKPELVEVLQRGGVTAPTPVQEKVIPLLLQGRDVMAQAQTGTGKTLAFLLPIFQRLNVDRPEIQALVLTPTRELAIQITAEARKLAARVGANVLATYGGQDVESQIRKLNGATHVVIATPGRLLDHLRRGTVRLHRVTMLVLDEADQMLHMGFLPEVEDVMSQAARDRCMILCSATMPGQIRSLARKYMRSPVEVQIKSRQVTLEEIEQVVVPTTDQTKMDDLCQKLDEYNPYLAIIFCRSKLRADLLHDVLTTRGYQAEVLHGDLSQAKREQVMRRFREARIQYLVATDVVARGLDVEGVSHVFNYDIPRDAESYIHRIGRTGRAGQTGVAITLVTPRDQSILQLIEKGIDARITRTDAPRAKGARAARVAGAGRPAGTARPAREQRPEGMSRREFARAKAARAAHAGGPAARAGGPGARAGGPGAKAGGPGTRAGGPAARAGRGATPGAAGKGGGKLAPPAPRER